MKNTMKWEYNNTDVLNSILYENKNIFNKAKS